ncbi:permease prefix domain 1-containing protein [Lolliginicoccus levis]|uniref:permease prefix domain 1-containing protein n=1 Tax=Lolliginicoccus levis TaxID=2919542 RepID=UPI00241CD526|nr:permease prefix domain 1-containing protein [Lolliginicoccus levis]
MTTLTERYVWDVVRRLPEKQRGDIAAELTVAITDMVDARTDAGQPHADAERAALVELGEPRALAGKYRDRPQYLIGPELFPDYVRLLQLLATIVLPVIAIVIVAVKLVEDEPIAGVLGSAIGVTIEVAVQLVFWVTLVFAIIERSGGQEDVLEHEDWDPDSLPATTGTTTISRGETVAGMAFILIAIGFLFWQHLRSPVSTLDDARVPMLDPELWNGWMQVIIAILVLSLAIEIAKYVRGQWNYPIAIANTAANVAFLAVIGWLASAEKLINPELLVTIAERAQWDSVPTINPWLIILVVAAIAIWDSVDGLRKSRAAA